MKKQLLLFGFAVAMATNSMAFNERVMFDATNEESKWTFLESKFISQVAEYKKSVWAHVQSAVTGLVAVGAATSFGALYHYNKLNESVDKALSFGNISAATALGATALHASAALECYLVNHANYIAVQDFFANWEENQAFVPATLQEGFAAIANTIELEGKDYVVNNANTIIDAIQFVVMRHFEKRYEKVLQVTATTALADAKTAGEILKNAVETGTKFGGSSK